MAHREFPHRARRRVLLSGPAGSGKTTACRLGYRVMAAAWGHPAGAIDTDQLYLNVDARWELPYDDARNAMVLAQAAQLAISLFGHGWRTVIICGNSLFDPADTAPVLTRLCPGRGGLPRHADPRPARRAHPLRRHARPRPRPARSRRGTADAQAISRLGRLDNSDMTPEQTLTELAGLVDNGAGRLRCPT